MRATNLSNTMAQPHTISHIASCLNKADSVLFVTGAGISAESGLPTYRGVGGLYADQHTEDGIPVEVALSGSMFKRNPALTWKYLWQIGSACLDAEPNAAHRIIAELETQKSNVWVLTQNVDGLHRAAGSTKVIEAHGDAFDLICMRCHARYDAKDLINNYQKPVELPPKCPVCAGIIRPNVVLFGEDIPENVLQGFRTLSSMRFDLVFSIGTSALFAYIAQPIFEAHDKGVPCIEINPAHTQVSDFCSHQLRMSAADAMQVIKAECELRSR